MPRFDLRIGLVTLTLLTVSGCIVIGERGGRLAETGETVRENVTIDRAKAGDAERVNVRLEMKAGELRVTGGAKELAETEFTYNVPSWKPEVRFDRAGFRGTLNIKQSGTSGTLGSAKNQWTVRLNNEIPIDFSLSCGAGENRLSLGDLDLRDVEVNMGAGRVELDLRGREPRHDYSVRVNGGVGEAMLKLPSDADIVATAAGGLGQVEVFGLEKRGGEWRSANAKGKATIHVEVHGGIGHIRLDAR